MFVYIYGFHCVCPSTYAALGAHYADGDASKDDLVTRSFRLCARTLFHCGRNGSLSRDHNLVLDRLSDKDFLKFIVHFVLWPGMARRTKSSYVYTALLRAAVLILIQP